jgi:ribosomal protein S17
MVEAIAWHPEYGIIAAPEIPLKKAKKKRHTIYAKKRRWYLPYHAPVSAITLTDDGDLLILERRQDSQTKRWHVWLSQLHLCRKKKRCRVKKILHLKGEKGEWGENFEGLANLGDGRYLMVSDNDGKTGRPTLFVLFSID